jgi:hypothetical protein
MDQRLTVNVQLSPVLNRKGSTLVIFPNNEAGDQLLVMVDSVRCCMKKVVCRVVVHCVYKALILTVLLFPYGVFIIATVELRVSVGSL